MGMEFVQFAREVAGSGQILILHRSTETATKMGTANPDVMLVVAQEGAVNVEERDKISLAIDLYQSVLPLPKNCYHQQAQCYHPPKK